MLLELLKAKGEYILLGDFNLHYPFLGDILVISADNIVNNLIYAIEAASLSLVTKVDIEI